MASADSKATPGDNTAGNADGGKKRWFLRKKQLEQDLEHVNREIYRRNFELGQTNKTLALLQAIDSLVLGPEEEVGSLSTKLAQEVTKAGGYSLVVIMGRPSGSHGGLGVFGWAADREVRGAAHDVMPEFALHGNLSWLGQNRNDPLRFVNLQAVEKELPDLHTASAKKVVADLKDRLGLNSVCFIRLSARQRLVGLMLVGFTDESRASLTKFEETLFMRLGEAVGIALDHKMLLEENQRVLRQLEASNHKLRVLDRTKDDFISMASHQLRTPLTSVKGYVSMVLDGDAGKITPLQRKLLTQSFISSQRMVYLISDLLNVSRLKTGKFIIENIQTNLAKVIQEEVDQLEETAKGRNLTLTYHRPENFPTLMLDETKIRQVMMNFIDNAVYYTPSGGHIDIYLANKPQSIEFTVVDDGIGVPRAEQHHLFSKFYRAPNAKRARPDGTGLGIFMAKKVIIAQGGAIIFKSQEGKGSTFGFTFAKDKLQPAPEGLTEEKTE